ncbi:hypothetical protein GQ457_05G016860 [Hibiscus cannabinus]
METIIFNNIISVRAQGEWKPLFSATTYLFRHMENRTSLGTLFHIWHHRVRMDKSPSPGLAPSGSKDRGPWLKGQIRLSTYLKSSGLNGQIIFTNSASFDQEFNCGLASSDANELITMSFPGQITITDSASLDHSRHGSSKSSGLHSNLAPSGSNGQVATAQAHQPRVRRI